ncbi:hypothetical protein A1O3_01720 [Capronia epimyces CBS 606.96]|uniref:Zn(2)-C6 fungal-type domain-containing protein n=1 Tax=Capronia epimyces CBS 606.96 TaxID=1182542 RepID=W9YKR7_9EURO|nr:uncharacterized protein A1O3_01720 [Capronia epimyces CBS 606.96]EXJ93163.1 hypothetical protein A1O3_01720 [Capronia epimyces CBS 606.96]
MPPRDTSSWQRVRPELIPRAPKPLETHDRTPALGSGGLPQAMSRSLRRRPRRDRASTACETCRIKKVKCNEGRPVCAFCQKHGIRCVYSQSTTVRPASTPTASLLLERIAALENRVDSLASQRTCPVSTTGSPHDPDPSFYSALSSSTTATSLGVLPQEPLSTPFTLEAASAEDHHSIVPPDNGLVGIETFSYGVADHRGRSSVEPESGHVGEGDIDPAAIHALVDQFLDLVCPLFPIICDVVLCEITSTVAANGFTDDLPSCMTLLVMSLAKAYATPHITVEDLAIFVKAVQLLSVLPLQLTLEFAQSQVLCALFLLKRHQLLDCWHWLHDGCNTLYAMIKQDEARKMSRPPDEKNTILRMYWICFNLDRDVTSELEILPRSHLGELENHLPLPIGCDESSLSHLQKHARIIYMFFLAETSLKAILARIMSMSASCEAKFPQETRAAMLATSPIVLELKNQLVIWEHNLPLSLGWSCDPVRDASAGSALATRLRLVYWLARFHLARPLVVHMMDNLGSQFSLEVWTALTAGLSAGYTLLRVLWWEEKHIDTITVMGKR